jgi:hypothetical protein
MVSTGRGIALWTFENMKAELAQKEAVFRTERVILNKGLKR